MKKILVFTNSVSGLYGFRKELLAELTKNHDLTVYSPLEGTFAIEKLEQMGCRLVNVKMERRGMNPFRDAILLRRIFLAVKSEKPNLVITYTIKPNIYGGIACRLLNTDYAANITGLGTAFEKQNIVNKIVVFLYNFALKKAKVVFFENSENQHLFIDKKIIRREQARLLNGAGVNLEQYEVLQYPENDGKIKFLFMGRVMAEKGVNELFNAMRMLKRDGINCSLDMLGDFEEDYEQKIKEAEAEGWLRYHGYQTDVRPYISGCDCFVLPSYHEGMANTNLECASSGRPVITSDIPGCKEAVIDGVSGLLCAPKSAESLYGAMKRMADMNVEDRKAMGLCGRKHMEKVFSKQKVVKDTLGHLV